MTGISLLPMVIYTLAILCVVNGLREQGYSRWVWLGFGFLIALRGLFL